MIVLHEKVRLVWTYDKTRHTIVELYPAGIIRNVAERGKSEDICDHALSSVGEEIVTKGRSS